MPEPNPASSHPTAAPCAARDLVKAAFQRSAGSDARIEWTEAEGGPEQLLVEWALTVDLAVVAQCQPEGQYEPDIADQLIMASGVPTLMLPPLAATKPDGSILVGWNGSREATRAVHEALPFLVRAQRVVVCAVGEVAIHSLDAAAGMLRRHGVRAEPDARDGPEAAAPEVLLELGAGPRRRSAGDRQLRPLAPARVALRRSRATCCARHRFRSCSAADVPTRARRWNGGSPARGCWTEPLRWVRPCRCIARSIVLS